MKRRLPILFAALVLLAAAAALWYPGPGAVARPEAAGSARSPAAVVLPEAAGTLAGAAPATEPTAGRDPTGSLLVRSVVVRDVDGRVAWRGDVDLAATLKRIAAGERDSHRNDGGVFGNRERLLPVQPSGYYREYVVRTPGIAHSGPQRLIVGRGGELYYTSDHYASFRRLR